MNTSLSYRAFLEELNSIKSVEGIRLGLERVSELLQRCGNPHRNFKSIVVAGTNGKGSVTAMMSNILKTAGYRVGTYISPHLLDIRERISIDGCWIDEESFLRIGKRILEIAKSMTDPPSFYEIITTIAFSYFNDKRIEIAVLEIGLGGRLDAVNVVHPIQSIITTIDFDHENYLGRTIESIAREKAGIIKENSIVVLGEEKEEAIKVIEAVSHEKGAPLYRKGRDFNFKVKRYSLEESVMDFESKIAFLPNVELGLRGEYQFLNTSIALEASLLLNNVGIKVSEKSMRDGVKNARWRGRFEIFKVGSKTVILDGAHNPHGMRALISSLKRIFNGKRILFVFGAMRDKNYTEMLKELSEIASKIIFTTIPGNERALSVEELMTVSKETAVNRSISFEGKVSPLEALKEALSSKEEIICICGSLYLIGKVLEEWNNIT